MASDNAFAHQSFYTILLCVRTSSRLGVTRAGMSGPMVSCQSYMRSLQSNLYYSLHTQSSLRGCLETVNQSNLYLCSLRAQEIVATFNFTNPTFGRVLGYLPLFTASAIVL